MTFVQRSSLVLLAASCLGPAVAQTTPAPVVTIQAERPTNRIDRQVYDVKADAAVTNNTAADALGNVPSVTVDPDGIVSLRGSSNVQILIDGKPSTMLQGDNRGAALNAMPSQDIESIEVINNPGAQFGNEGGGGPILNLVMRRNRTPGGMAVVNANAGPHGRANTSLSGSYQQGRLGFQGGVNFRRDGRNATTETERERIAPATGAISASSQASRSTGLNDSNGINGTLTYNLDDKTVVAAQASLLRRSNDQRTVDDYVNADNNDYRRTGVRGGDSVNGSWGLRLDRKGSVAGETFKMDLRVTSTDTCANSAYGNVYTSGAPARLSRQDNRAASKVADFTGDYERPVDQGIVKLGFKLSDMSNGFDTRYADLDPLGGLRVENTALAVHQYTTAVEADNRYTNVIPSLFVSYKASDAANVRLSYAHRIRRPNGNDLNPFVVYRDDVNVSAGNPALKPSQSDSLELGYETSFGKVEASVRAFVRQENDVIIERSYFVSDTVLLTTRDNGGENRSGGLEFSLSGKLTPKFSFNTSGNLARTEQRSVDSLGVPVLRESTALSMRARGSYEFTAKDTVQFTVNAQGKTLTGQGGREPATTANLSLRHALTPRLNLVMNVTDLFDSNKTATTIDTPLLHESSVRRFDGRVMYFGLSYRLGGVAGMPAREPGARGRPGQGGPRGAGEQDGQ